jgi:hypothetical protein
MKQYINEVQRMQQLAGIKISLTEGLEFKDIEIGDKLKVTKSPDSKIMQYLKSAVSAFYDRKIQPQTGDIFEVLPNEYKEFDGKEYTVKNINRPQEFIKALGPGTKEAIISMPKKWVDALYYKGYFTNIN